MSKTIDRPIRMASLAPFYLRRPIRDFLWRCGECPERIICFERIIGHWTLNEFLKFECPDSRQLTNEKNDKGKYLGKNSLIIRQLSIFIAKTLKNNCRNCPALNYCSKGIVIHVDKLSVLDLPKDIEERTKRLKGNVQRCADCPELANCIEYKFLAKDIKAKQMLWEYLRARTQCTIKRISK